MKDTITRREVFTPEGLQIRSAADGTPTRTIEGYAIVFDTPSQVLWSDGDTRAREMIAAEAVTVELLDSSDIFMTMFHDPQLILARSNKGAGTLHYEIDARGVRFWFDAPNTADGDKALELVRLGNLTGCSFSFGVAYADESCVERKYTYNDDRSIDLLFVVRRIKRIYDFTISENPAYPTTTVAARDFGEAVKSIIGAVRDERSADYRFSVAAMRRTAATKIF